MERLLEQHGNPWKKAAEELIKTYKAKDQRSFHARAYLRAVMQGNTEQATHLRKNVMDKKLAKEVVDKLMDLVGRG
jgi:hypothetical protein